MKKIFFFALSFAANQLVAQTIFSVPVGKVLAAGNTGITLPDGTIITADRTRLGNANGNPDNELGIYNQFELGGIFNGIQNPAVMTTGPNLSGITLPGYSGSKIPKDFTRIVSNPFYVRNGVTTDYQNTVGFYVNFSKPTKLAELLFLDCDGSGNGSGASNNGGNNEWLSCFGYGGYNAGTNSYPYFVPSYTLAAATYPPDELHLA